MRTAILIIAATMLSGCAATYKQNTVAEPSAKLIKNHSVAISIPANGSYGDAVYSESGKMTAMATRAAFARYASSTSVVPECKDLACLKSTQPAKFDYYVVPEILHWEERATEWSGIPDRIEVKVSVYEGRSWEELALTVISGKSKWMTFGGDHPQDLLADPLNSYAGSLY